MYFSWYRHVMDTLWLIVGIILMLIGILGCFLPLLPGPPLCYVALLLQQLRSDHPFYGKISLDLGRYYGCSHRVGLCYSCGGHEKVWRKQIWCVGIDDRLDCRVLDGAVRNYYWAIRGGFHRWNDSEQWFRACAEGCMGIVRGIFIWYFVKARCVSGDGVVSDRYYFLKQCQLKRLRIGCKPWAPFHAAGCLAPNKWITWCQQSAPVSPTM